MVVKLIYLSYTRPNIAHVMSMVSQFMHTLLKPHLEVVYQILQHLKAALSKGNLFKKGKELKLQAYQLLDRILSYEVILEVRNNP